MSGIKGLFLLSMVLVATFLGAQGAPVVEAAGWGEWLFACKKISSYPAMKYVLISSDGHCHSVQEGATLISNASVFL